MRDTHHFQEHEDISRGTSGQIPAQFRPSSQLAWRTSIVVTSAICTGMADAPAFGEPERHGRGPEPHKNPPIALPSRA